MAKPGQFQQVVMQEALSEDKLAPGLCMSALLVIDKFVGRGPKSPLSGVEKEREVSCLRRVSDLPYFFFKSCIFDLKFVIKSYTIFNWLISL